MSNTADAPRPEQGNVNLTGILTDRYERSQLIYMFMKIERKLPNFNHMLIAMNEYAFMRSSRLKETNDFSEFCGVLKKGLSDWYTSNINGKIKRVPNFIDLINQIYDDDILMKGDKIPVHSTSLNSDISEIPDTEANSDASTSDIVKACANIQISASTNASESAGTSADACFPTSADTCFPKSADTCFPTSDGKNGYLMAKKIDDAKLLENTIYTDAFVPWSDMKRSATKFIMDNGFKIIMPTMDVHESYSRRQLPIDDNIQHGNDFERHWWRQTNDKIILNLDISDLIVEELIPNIKVVVTSVGFKVKIKHLKSWNVLLSNKFQKLIRKSKWVINKYMHVKLTLQKRKKEFWKKCLVTETREHKILVSKNHTCSTKCRETIIMTRPKIYPKGKEPIRDFVKYFLQGYNCEDAAGENSDDFTVTGPPATEKNPQAFVVDPSTVRSLNSDFENPPSTENPSIWGF